MDKNQGPIPDADDDDLARRTPVPDHNADPTRKLGGDTPPEA